MKGLKRSKRIRKGESDPRKKQKTVEYECSCGEKIRAPEYVEGVECSVCLMKGI